MTTLDKYYMTDSDMEAVRAEFPHLTWTRSKSGGADAQAGKGGLRLWIVPDHPYQVPRIGWKADVLAPDYLILGGVDAKTFKGCCNRLRKFLKSQASMWAAAAGGE